MLRYHDNGLAVSDITKEASFYSSIGGEIDTPPIVDNLQNVKLQLIGLGN